MQNNVLERLLSDRILRRNREREGEAEALLNNYRREADKIIERLAQIGFDDVEPSMDRSDGGRAFVPLELGWQIQWNSQTDDLQLYNEWLNVTAKWSRVKLDEILDDIYDQRHGYSGPGNDVVRLLDPRDLPLWKSMGLGPHRRILFTRIPGGWIMRMNNRVSFVPWTDRS